MTAQEQPNVVLVEAKVCDRELIATMLETYLLELQGLCAGQAAPNGDGGYPYLDAYWSEEGRYAFRLQCADEDIGFAFVRGPASTGNGCYELAEFYVRNEWRRQGLGRQVARELWRRFPGQWQLTAFASNLPAVAFWRAMTAESAQGEVFTEVRTSGSGPRVFMSFHVPDVG
jgi:predicted acetyltransferase